MSKVDSTWYRQVVAPYWCQDSPLNYEFRQLAMEGKVGKFNLYWWLVGPDGYHNDQIHAWINFVAPRVEINKCTLIGYASLCTLPSWNALVRVHLPVMQVPVPLSVTFAGLAARS